MSELHETIRGGERVLIRQLRPEDMTLYPDFLDDVSAEDLRLRFFARIAEFSAAEIHKLTHLDYRHEMAFMALDEDTGHMLGLVCLKDELDEKTAEFPKASKPFASLTPMPLFTTSGLFPYDPHCLWNGATPCWRQSAITSRIHRRFTGRAPPPLSPPDMSQSGNGPLAGNRNAPSAGS